MIMIWNHMILPKRRINRSTFIIDRSERVPQEWGIWGSSPTFTLFNSTASPSIGSESALRSVPKRQSGFPDCYDRPGEGDFPAFTTMTLS